MDTPLVIIKTYIPNTRACAIQLKLDAGGNGGTITFDYICWNLRRNLCVSNNSIVPLL